MKMMKETSSILILSRLSVIDVGCGKGGDLNKWRFAGTRNYFGVDISYKALQDANQRKVDSNPANNIRIQRCI